MTAEFTGLLDRRGEQICDGDVINIYFGRPENCPGGKRITYENVYVCWHTGRLQWVVKGGNLMTDFASLGPECYVNPEYEKINPRRSA